MHILGGEHKLREIKTPKGLKTRPTTAKIRRSLFDMLQNQIVGAQFLDLFAGSGAMGLEALSRGAKRVTFVEKDRQALHCIKENLQAFGLEKQADILFKDAFAAVNQLAKNSALFNFIYVDPPYNYDVSGLLEVLSSLLADDGMIVVEQRKNTSLATKSLKETSHKKIGDTILYFFIHNLS